MVAADHNRRFDFAAFHQLIHREPKLSALAIAQPANPRRQTLKLNSLLSELHPARQRLIFWKQFERESICTRDIRRIAAQCHPAKWTASFAKQRTNVFGNKTRN